MSTYRERRAERAERLREWAAKRAARSSGQFKRAHELISGIPLGQPILVGHHSERRHRRTLERSDAAMRAGWEDSNKAADMASRAENIEDAADRAIYLDDPDAIERLTAKIAKLEAQREARKAANVIVRSKRLDAATKIAQLAELLQCPPDIAAKLLEPDYCGRYGFPSYALANLSGTIAKERGRLATLHAAKTSVGTAVVAPTRETATARAGLMVTETMTTPAKAWKKPRPVWNVSGNLAYWRPVLVDQLGGSWYRGVVSFWEDPTDAIEDAAHRAEDPHCTCNDCIADHAEGQPA
jgi:Domain of unknown function (DUF3560)